MKEQKCTVYSVNSKKFIEIMVKIYVPKFTVYISHRNQIHNIMPEINILRKI